MKFYRNTDVEARAEARLAELEQLLGRPLTPPVPIDLIAEKLLGLDFLWDAIDELPGESILAGLDAPNRLIVLNENRRDTFLKHRGLERSSKGHEMGHWDLFIDLSSLDHPSLFDRREDGPIVFRSSTRGDLRVIKALISTAEGQELYRRIQVRADHPDEARAVNRYAAALSMPKALLIREVTKIDRTHWPRLYELAERFDVTITALVTRLEQLDLLFVGKDKKLFESREQANGQRTLF